MQLPACQQAVGRHRILPVGQREESGAVQKELRHADIRVEEGEVGKMVLQPADDLFEPCGVVHQDAHDAPDGVGVDLLLFRPLERHRKREHVHQCGGAAELLIGHMEEE